MNVITTRDAASSLGMSIRHVQRLAAAGELVRGQGNTLAVASVMRAAAERGRGRAVRPWAPHTAWAAIALLTGDEDRASRIGDAQLSRLRARLRVTSADQLVDLTRSRATVRAYDGHPAVVTRVRDVAALSRSAWLEAGLTREGRDRVDGYVSSGELRRLVRDLALVPALGEAVVVLRETDHPDARSLVEGSDVVAALDAAGHLDPRVRAAGRERLAALLRAVR